MGQTKAADATASFDPSTPRVNHTSDGRLAAVPALYCWTMRTGRPKRHCLTILCTHALRGMGSHIQLNYVRLNSLDSQMGYQVMLCREAEHVDLLVDTNPPRDSELVEVDWLADSDPSDDDLDSEEEESHRKDGFVGKHYIAVLSGLAVNGSAVHHTSA